MRAVRWYVAKDIRVEETQIHKPNENQVKIGVKFTDISERRLAKTKETRATKTFDARGKGIPQKIKELTGYDID